MTNYNLAAASPGKSVATREVKKAYQPKYFLPHVIIPQRDVDWARQQPPTLKTLWLDCWYSDPYGSRWMPLNTTLRGSNLKKVKRLLREAFLFDFKTEMRVLEGVHQYETFVINLHGSRTDYWKLQPDADNAEVGADNAEVGADSGYPPPSTPDTASVSKSLSIISVSSQYPPHSPPPAPKEEEEKILQEKEEEGTQEGNLLRDGLSSPQQEEATTRNPRSVDKCSGDGGAAPCVTQPAADDDASFIQWVESEYLPTTKDYQAGKIRNLRKYTLKVVANDGDTLWQDWLKSQKQASWAAYCLEIEAQVRARAIEWEAVGRRITIYHQLEDGLPAVAIDSHSHISAPDFLVLPIDHRQQSELPPVAQPLLELLKQRPGRQRKLNNFEAWARLGDFQIESYWVDLLLAAWEDSALRQQISRIIFTYPTLGLIVEGDRLVEDF